MSKKGVLLAAVLLLGVLGVLLVLIEANAWANRQSEILGARDHH